MSSGFNNHEKKTNRTHTSKITLLPSKGARKNLETAKQLVQGMRGGAKLEPALHQSNPGFTFGNRGLDAKR